METRTVEQTTKLREKGEAWEEFKSCWAFFQSWASQKGDALNVIEFKEKYTGDTKAGAEADKLPTPGFPIHRSWGMEG